MTEQDLSDILVGDESEDVVIEHKGKEYRFKIKELPWVKVNSILSRCVKVEGRKVFPDIGEFYELYLEEALIEAPWPKDKTRLFLRRLGHSFGNKLRKFLPEPLEVTEDEELKKE